MKQKTLKNKLIIKKIIITKTKQRQNKNKRQNKYKIKCDQTWY